MERNLEMLKSAFTTNYYKSVNSVLTAEQETKLRVEYEELEYSLITKMSDEEFEDFYKSVHCAAWGDGSYDDYV